MIMANYEDLRNMAGLLPEANPSTQADDLYSQSFVSKSQEWEARNHMLEPHEKFSLWERNVGTQEFEAANPSEYHETRERLHPLGKEGARKEYLDNLDKELQGRSFEEQETLLKNKARQLPTYAWEYLDRVPVLQQAVDSKHVNRALRSSVDVHTKIFAGLDFSDLDTDVSHHSHLDDLMLTVDMGIADRVKVVNGRISLPDSTQPEGYAPVFSMPPSSNLGIEQLKMNRVYIRPQAKKSILNGYEMSLMRRRKQEKQTLDIDYNRAADPSTPKEFIANALIDRDSQFPDGGALTLNMIGSIIKSRGDQYQSYKELLGDYKELLIDVFDKTHRRISDVSDGQ
tara:strand:- start:9778 stop:10803 length:1026 start_codon:yes stop_codon:yes gene_type:complete